MRRFALILATAAALAACREAKQRLARLRGREPSPRIVTVPYRPVEPRGEPRGDAAGAAESQLPPPLAPFGVDAYRARRERLMKEIGGGVAVVFGRDSMEDGRQDPDFLYLDRKSVV